MIDPLTFWLAFLIGLCIGASIILTIVDIWIRKK